MQRNPAEKNACLKWDMGPWPVRLCCTLLYYQSYQHLWGDQMQTQSWTPYWVSEDKYIRIWNVSIWNVISWRLWDVRCSLWHNTFIYVIFYKYISPQGSFPEKKRNEICCFTKTKKIFDLWSKRKFGATRLFVKIC